jgi:hypothetical protein
VKLADFGCSKRAKDGRNETEETGKAEVLCPEQRNNKGITLGLENDGKCIANIRKSDLNIFGPYILLTIY